MTGPLFGVLEEEIAASYRHTLPIRQVPVRGENRGSPGSTPDVGAAGPSAQTRVQALVAHPPALEAGMVHVPQPARPPVPLHPCALSPVSPAWRSWGAVRPVPSRAALAGARDRP